MENDAPVVGQDAPTVNSKKVEVEIATAHWLGRSKLNRRGAGKVSESAGARNEPGILMILMAES